MVGAPTISLYSWKQLARWSIEYSCLNKTQKEEGQHYLAEAWKEFCTSVVNDYEELLMKDGCLEIDEEKAKAAYEDRTGINRGMGRPTNNDMPDTTDRPTHNENP